MVAGKSPRFDDSTQEANPVDLVDVFEAVGQRNFRIANFFKDGFFSNRTEIVAAKTDY